MSESDIRRVLDFWFAGTGMDSPRVDSRMDRWFGVDDEMDEEVRTEFGELVRQASDGELMDWADTAQGCLALIIVLDQFRRNIFRNSPEAFTQDHVALKLCIEGTVAGYHKKLTPIQQLFFFLPLQHAESIPVQKKSVGIFQALAENVTDTLRETFLTTAQFAELHHDIVVEFGRFPHRNSILGRENTDAEAAYLAGVSPTFGQSLENR
jgi:uncharacterized protein (DUF924 family)